MSHWPILQRINGAIYSQCRCQFTHLFTPSMTDSRWAHSPYLVDTRDPKGVLAVLMLYTSLFCSMSMMSSGCLISRLLSSNGGYAFSKETMRWRLGPSSLSSHKNDMHICRIEQRIASVLCEPLWEINIDFYASNMHSYMINIIIKLLRLMFTYDYDKTMKK